MSIFSKVWKKVRGVVAPAVGMAVGGPLGGLIGGVLGGGSAGAPPVVSRPTSRAVTVRKALPAIIGGSRIIPGAGAITGALGGVIAGAAGARAIGTAMSDGTVRKRRVRRKGITATELKNHARVERFLQKNFKCKTGGTRKTYLRKT